VQFVSRSNTYSTFLSFTVQLRFECFAVRVPSAPLLSCLLKDDKINITIILLTCVIFFINEYSHLHSMSEHVTLPSKVDIWKRRRREFGFMSGQVNIASLTASWLWQKFICIYIIRFLWKFRSLKETAKHGSVLEKLPKRKLHIRNVRSEKKYKKRNKVIGFETQIIIYGCLS